MNNEKLFWKVIHNKYIFNIIIQSIHTRNHYKIIKFKDIYSLEWMVSNNLFELLNLKLKANEYIEINKNGLSLLMDNISLTESSNFENYDSISKKSMELLLKYKSLELIQFEIYKMAIKIVNLNVIDILKQSNLNEFITTVYPLQLLKEKTNSQQETEIASIYINSKSEKEYQKSINFYLHHSKPPIYNREVMFMAIPWASENVVYCLKTGIYKDKETIDWVYNHYQVSWSNYSKNISHPRFESTELFNYATNKFKSNDTLSLSLIDIYSGSGLKNNILEYLLINALSRCDLVELMLVNQREIKFYDNNLYFKDFINHGKPLSSLIELVCYINSTGFKNFDGLSIYNFIKSLIKINEYNFLKLIDIGNFQRVDHTRYLIYIFSPKVLNEIIFKNGDCVFNYPEIVRELTTIGTPHPKFINYNQPIEDLILCIKILVNKFNQNQNIDKLNLNLLKGLIEDHYIIFLQNKFITIRQLKYVYQLIKCNKYPIELEYHSGFYWHRYFKIKSKKISKFIEIYKEHTGLFYYIPPSDIDFGYIFGEDFDYSGESVDEIIYKLMEETYNFPQYLQFEVFDLNLKFSLKNGQIDFFFICLLSMESVIYFNQGFHFQRFKPQNFKFNPSTIQLVCRVLDYESFKKFISFNNISDGRNMIPTENNEKSMESLIVYLNCILNHSLSDDEILTENRLYIINLLKLVINNNYQEMNIDPHVYKNRNKIISKRDSLLLKYKNLFFSSNPLIPLDQLFLIRENQEIESNYNVVLRDLFLKSCPNHPYFKITIKTIEKAIDDGKINFLKYYYQNGIIKENIELNQFLKNKLINFDWFQI